MKVEVTRRHEQGDTRIVIEVSDREMRFAADRDSAVQAALRQGVSPAPIDYQLRVLARVAKIVQHPFWRLHLGYGGERP